MTETRTRLHETLWSSWHHIIQGHHRQQKLFVAYVVKIDSKGRETVKRKINNITEEYNSRYKVEAAALGDNDYLSKFQNTN